jgi:NAD(P)-dependent dehydrogenase (short-subunit alcohol dehydrogenase family)
MAPKTKASGSRKTALIVGASRGLGLAMVEQLLKKGWQVIATERKESALHELAGRFPGLLKIENLDVTNEEQIPALKHRLALASLDLLFVNAGIGDGAFDKIGDISNELFMKVMLTNTLSPLRVLESLHDLVQGRGTIGVMSSELGSVTGNAHGGWEVYRASKAALNTLLRSFSARDRRDGRTYLAMTPGWVRTDLGGPEAALAIDESIPGLVDVIISQSGKGGVQYLNYQGYTVPW